MSKLLYTSADWKPEILEKTWEVIDRIAREKYGLTYYEPQIEVVTSQQMIHYGSTIGLPFTYDHWSFGKEFAKEEKEYRNGETGLAYEMIINSNPAICYIMENNSMTMQATVLAHAAVGHNSFFKNNELFKLWTHPESIMMYSKFAREYIKECEEKYGSSKVERTLDAAHALRYVGGIDKYERVRVKRKEELEKMEFERREYEELMHNPLWRTFSDLRKRHTRDENLFARLKELGAQRPQSEFPWPFPEENILYFIEKNSPALEDWQREIIHIVRRFAQYFYPQIKTKVMNEGYASFWHYTIMNDLYDEGYISEGNMLEFLISHTAITRQNLDKVSFDSLNPYAIGFRMFRKIRQVCENPTERDKQEFKLIIGQPWLEVFQDIITNYDDSSFFGQFLSSDIIEEFGMFNIELFNDEEGRGFKVKEIQERDRLSAMREALSDRYAYSSRFPTIEVVDYSFKKDRTLHLVHQPTKGMALDERTAKDCWKYIHKLWGYPIKYTTTNAEGGLPISHFLQHL